MRAIGWLGWAVAMRGRDHLDALAVRWILGRKTLTRRQAEALIETLAARIGARVEFEQRPGT